MKRIRIGSWFIRIGLEMVEILPFFNQQSKLFMGLPNINWILHCTTFLYRDKMFVPLTNRLCDAESGAVFVIMHQKQIVRAQPDCLSSGPDCAPRTRLHVVNYRNNPIVCLDKIFAHAQTALMNVENII